MKRTFAILFASTALTLGVGLPAWSAMHDAPRPQASREAVDDASDESANLLFASDDGHRDQRSPAALPGCWNERLHFQADPAGIDVPDHRLLAEAGAAVGKIATAGCPGLGGRSTFGGDAAVMDLP